MTKKVIAIISVLKPVDDTRSYEKIATSMDNTNKYDINIIGFSSKNISPNPNISFYPIFHFKRNSLARLVASLKTLKILLKLKPELIIVNTPELLLVTIFNKILFGSKIVYDIQENYYRNILFTTTYPSTIKYPLALLVRSLEVISSPFVDQFILAEKVYKTQLNFTSSKSIVIKNKALIPISTVKRAQHKDLTFVYSGTIAEHYGIFDAIEFIKKLKDEVDNLKLIIIGYAAKEKTYKKLLPIIENNDFIHLIGGDTLVPHNQILNEIENADFCLLPYQKSRTTEGRIPTKLFECLAMEKPVIITPNPAWNNLIHENNAGIINDFNRPNESFISALRLKYYGNNLSYQYSWSSCEQELLKTISNLV